MSPGAAHRVPGLCLTATALAACGETEFGTRGLYEAPLGGFRILVEGRGTVVRVADLAETVRVIDGALAGKRLVLPGQADALRVIEADARYGRDASGVPGGRSAADQAECPEAEVP